MAMAIAGQERSAISFVKLLKACAKKKDLYQGTRLHAEIVKGGLLEKSVYIGSSLVSMYAQCSSFVRAQKVFDELPTRDVVSWNALIAGYSQHIYTKHAIECFELMENEGISPDSVTFICILKVCACIQAVNKGELIHCEILREGLLQKNHILSAALVDMYAKCGLLAKAQQIFDGLPSQNTILWTSLIAGYAQHGYNQDALDCFECMQQGAYSPDAHTITCILKVCARLGAIVKGQELHSVIRRQGLLGNNIMVAKSLLYMYVKCGAIERAQELFDEIPLRDATMCTVLISGYVQHGQNGDAINCFEWMQELGPSPDLITFACILKAYGSTGALGKGEKIHTEIVRRGLLKENNIVGTSLLDMYSKCGALAKAQQVFDELPVQDEVAWTALLGGYTQHGHAKKVLRCAEEMQFKGICLDTAVCVCVLKACSCIGAIGKGSEVHAQIVRRGLLEKSIELGNALLDMYVKCCEFATTEEVFDELPLRDQISWNTLIAGYSQCGLHQEAIHYFEGMCMEGILADETTFACVLKAYGSMQELHKGQAIHAEVVRREWLVKGHTFGSALVDLYAKCSLLAEAHEVFDMLAVQDVVAWSSLIGGYAQHDFGKEAIMCFEQMQLDGLCPDAVAFGCVLKACGIIGAIERGQCIHQEITSNYEMNSLVGNTLVDMYAKCGALERAQVVFNELSDRNIISWNALIGGYAQHGHAHEAIGCFERMEFEGIPPDEIAYTYTLNACHDTRCIHKIEALHNKLVNEKLLEKSIIVGTALVDAYGKSGEVAKAKDVFDDLIFRDLVLWNALIAGYAQHGHHADAIAYFNRMPLEGFFPNDATYACVAKACGSMGSFKKVQEIQARIIGEGSLGVNAVLGTVLVKCGELTEAQLVFEELPGRDIISWNVLLEGHAQLGEYANVLSLYNKMVRQGIEPNVFTFTILLYACSHSGLVDMFQVCFEKMSTYYDIIPNLDYYACMLDLFGRAGLLGKMPILIQKMPCVPNLRIWHTVMGACQKWVNVELGRLAFEHVVELDEKDVGTYISMSNIYATAGMQEKVDMCE